MCLSTLANKEYGTILRMPFQGFFFHSRLIWNFLKIKYNTFENNI